MPRPSKQINRQRVAAAVAWKKGNREEAQKLWAEADKARKERQAKKKNKKVAKPEGAEPAEGQ